MRKYASNMLCKISQDLFHFFLLKYNALSLLSVLGKTNPEVLASSFNQSDIKSKPGLTSTCLSQQRLL